jgi:uncharacterized membrane protein YqjE
VGVTDDGRGRSRVLDRSTPDLIRRLIDDANGLIELEIRLAKLEAKENLLSALGGGKSLGIAAGAGVLALIGLVVLIITGLAALFRLILPPGIAEAILGGDWFWALLFTAATGAAAGLFALRGIRQVKISPLQKTRESLREDVEWLKQPTRTDGA